MKTVLFLCTGNYYRSRFAEVFFNWQAGQQGLHWVATSRGLSLQKSNPGPMSCHAIARLCELGVPLDKYLRLPLPVTVVDFAEADHVVAVKETEHRPLIQSRFPASLRQVEFWEVHDLDCAGPELAIPQLEREVVQLVARLVQMGPPPACGSSAGKLL
jgi:protein-tyrosine phosphatase